MMEVTLRLVNVKDSFYIIVPEAHYKLLKLLKSTTFKKNSVVSSEIDRMLSNKQKLRMPVEQWHSLVGHVFFTGDDASLNMPHKELRDRILVGAHIHHKKKTCTTAAKSMDNKRGRGHVGNLSKGVKFEVVSNEEDVAKHDENKTLESYNNRKIAEGNMTKKRIAVGASSGSYIMNIIMYLTTLNLSTTIYLNTQTGTPRENFGYVVNAMQGFNNLCDSVVSGQRPDVDGIKVLNYILDALFVTPTSYLMGMGDHVLEWRDVGYKHDKLLNLIKGKDIPQNYIDIADDLAKLRGMPFEDILRYLKMTDLPEDISDDRAAELNDSAELMFSYFPDVHEFFESKGAFGTDRAWGELLNGRQMKTMFSYAEVWNQFRYDEFLSRLSNTMTNLLFGGNGDSWFNADPENMRLRRQTLVTFSILSCLLFPGVIHAYKLTRKMLRSKEQKKKDKEYEQNKYGYYDERRRKTWAEQFLDIFETMQVAFILLTTMVEFVGITNVNGTGKSYDTFISESYSSNWYYLTSLFTVSHIQPTIRNMLGTQGRHPDRLDFATPAKVALELTFVIITTNNVDDFFHNMLGTGGSSEYGQIVSKFIMIGFGMTQLYKLSKYISNKMSTDSEIMSNIIETHATLVKDHKTRPLSKYLRNRLSHHKAFRRAAIRHMSAI